MIIEELVNKNMYPIVFVGAGIPKRYLLDYPSWEELLETLWVETDISGSYYGYMNVIKEELKESGGFSDEELKFKVNVKMASFIEKEFNDKFFKEKIIINDFSNKDAHKQNISPFKKFLSKKFLSYKIKSDLVEDELINFKKFIRKTNMIITTNYDEFIEDTYNGKNFELKTYIGQEGFFNETIGMAELFKIHGSSKKPETLIINEEDYNDFHKNSILLTSKILVSLIDSPIIFIGYSLTDINVRNIIKNFTSQLPKTDSRISSNRIIFIEREEGTIEFKEEIRNDKEIGSYTVIKTDNFNEIYRKLSGINQGLTPVEIRKYQKFMKRIILSKGEKGVLDSYLISPLELHQLESDLNDNKPIVVAFGDRKNIFVLPNTVTYFEDYVTKKDEIALKVALEYIAQAQTNARIPFQRLLNRIKSPEDIGLEKQYISRINDRSKSYMNYEDTIKTISNSNRIKLDRFEDYLNYVKEKELNNKEIDILTYNLKKFYHDDKNKIEEYLKKDVLEILKRAFSENGQSQIRTALRKLYYIYDILEYGEYKEKPIQIQIHE